MKKLLYCLAILSLMAGKTYAQNGGLADGVKENQLPVIYLPSNVSVHFNSPEPIQYVDISTRSIIGDLPVKNILRIRQADSTKFHGVLFSPDAVVTIIGAGYIAQYHILFANEITARDARTEIEILPQDMHPLDISGTGLSESQIRAVALNLFIAKPGSAVEKSDAFGLSGRINHLYTLGDYIFIDLSYQNHTKLSYDIDAFRFKIDDKKVTKASNIQSVELTPLLALFDNPSFQKYYRNIFVFKKMTFPGNKLLYIELSEKQLSGRVITLNISYKDVLNADTIPLK